MRPKTIQQIAYNYPTILFLYNYDDYEIPLILMKNGVSIRKLYSLKQDKWYNIGICNIMLQELRHDVLNSACHLDIKGKKVLYVTDTSDIPFEAKNYDLYLIEANYHSREELEKRIKEAQDKGEYTYLVRVLQTHLCEDDAIQWLKENMGDNSEYQFIHISKENGDNNV